MIVQWIFAFLVSVGVLTVLLKSRYRVIFLDTPDRRKMHQRLVPRMGGFGVITASALAFAFQGVNPLEWALWGGAGALLLLGFLDDSSLPYYLKLWWARRSNPQATVQPFHLRVRYKLLIEVGLVFAVVWWLDLAPQELLFGNYVIPVGLLAFPATCFWVIGVMNAFNLIDGIDGLCGGVGFLSLLAIAFLGAVLGLPQVTGASLVVAVALLGFLSLNIAPARLFMGDMGSLFVGFTVAVLSLQLLNNPIQPVNSLAVLFLAGLPVLDVFIAIFRRMGDVPAGSSFKTRLKRVVAADNNHMHHRLLYLGMGHMRASLVLYTISSILLLGAILFVVLPIWLHAYILAYLLFAVALSLVPIYYRDRAKVLRQNLLATMRGGSRRTYVLGLVAESGEVHNAIEHPLDLPFQVRRLQRSQLQDPVVVSGLDALLIEQQSQESAQTLLEEVDQLQSTWRKPMALVVAHAGTNMAAAFRNQTLYQKHQPLLAVYNRPIYIWPLLLSLLEQLHGERSTSTMPLLGTPEAL